MPEISDRFRVNSGEIAAKVIDGEAIIINLTTGVYYSMDSVGGRIWKLLESHHDLDTISNILAAEYDAEAESCREDVLGLVQQLLDENLLVPTMAEPAEQVTSSGEGSRLPYSPPSVSIYRDMGDLLALDPPVPGLEPIPWDDPARTGQS